MALAELVEARVAADLEGVMKYDAAGGEPFDTTRDDVLL